MKSRTSFSDHGPLSMRMGAAILSLLFAWPIVAAGLNLSALDSVLAACSGSSDTIFFKAYDPDTNSTHYTNNPVVKVDRDTTQAFNAACSGRANWYFLGTNDGDYYTTSGKVGNAYRFSTAGDSYAGAQFTALDYNTLAPGTTANTNDGIHTFYSHLDRCTGAVSPNPTGFVGQSDGAGHYSIWGWMFAHSAGTCTTIGTGDQQVVRIDRVVPTMAISTLNGGTTGVCAPSCGAALMTSSATVSIGYSANDPNSANGYHSGLHSVDADTNSYVRWFYSSGGAWQLCGTSTNPGTTANQQSLTGTVNCTLPSSGTYNLTAVAQDLAGNCSGSAYISSGTCFASTGSTPTLGTVIYDSTAPTPNPPDVSATSTASVYQATANGTVFFRPAAASSIALTASANDPETGVSKITFQNLTPTTGWTPSPSLPNADMSSPYTEGLGFSGSAVSATIQAVAQNGVGLDTSPRTLTLTVDSAAPTLAFTSPTAGTTTQPSGQVNVSWTESDGSGAGVGSRSLQRQKTTQTGPGTCNTGGWANDGSASTGPSPLLVNGLALNTCYRWVLNGADFVGNPASAVTSGTVIRDATGQLGQQPQHSFEAWDLGAGDTLGVNVAYGNLVITHPIVSLPIRGSRIAIDLTYNSHDATIVGMGPGWRLNVFRRLTLNADGSVTFTDADGARYDYTVASTVGTVTTYNRPASLYATLVKDTSISANEFVLTFRDLSVDKFDISGSEAILVRSEDRFANGVTFAYVGGTNRISTITDTAGSRTIDFAYDGSNRLTSITDWAYVSSGVVQTGATGSRRVSRFFYDGSSNLIGWADGLNTSGSCPTGGSHLTCLTVSGGLVTAVTETQTYETLSSGALGTATRPVSTQITYSGPDVATVQDAEGAVGTFTQPALGQVKLVRPGTPASETTYALLATNDVYGRIGSVKRKLGAAQIETQTTYNATYPLEPATVTENKGGGALERVTNYTYLASSLGLLSRLDEPLDGTYRRWTDYTYNANNDVTQKIVSRSGDTATDTVTRYCYTTSGCATTATDLLLRSTIENYVDGTAGGANGNVEDVTTGYLYDAYGQRTRQTRQNYAVGGTLLDQAAIGWTYDTSGNLTTEIRNYVSGTVTNPGDDITPNATTNDRTDLTTAYTVDTAGNRVSSADPRRAIETAKGTSLGSDDFISRTAYDALGEVLASRLPTTPGQADCSPTPACREATTIYDELGLVREARDINDLVTATRYDKAGRTLETYEDPAPAGGASTTSVSTYDAQGRLLTLKDRNQAAPSATLGSTLYVYDEFGRQTDVTEAYNSSPDLANITHSTYDNLGQKLTEETGFGTGTGQTTTWTYDIGGRAIRTDDEFTCTTTTYDYRNLPQVESSGLATGTCSGTAQRTFTSTYDALGRLTQRAITAGTDSGDVLSASTYDGAGHQLSSSTTKASVTTATTYTVNQLDEVFAEVRSEAGTAISWTKSNRDAAGNVTDRCVWNATPGTELCKAVGQSFTTTPAVQTTSAYDSRNNRINLLIPSVGETTYDPAHNYQVQAIYTPTGTGKEHQTLYGYDDQHRLWTITQQLCTISSGHGCSSTVATGSDAYTYDDNDNRTQVVESKSGGTATTTNYCYDGLDRLRATKATTACTPTSGDETYTYDDAGNRTAAAGTNFAYNASGQLCKTGSTSCTSPNVTYDATGRTLTWNGWTLTYDGDGHLASACKVAGCATGDKVTMRYDADGHRIELITRPNGGATTTVTFRYQDGALAQELTGGTVSRTYVTDDAGAIVKFCDPDCSGTNPQYLPTWNGHGDALAVWRIETTGALTLANSYTYTTWGAATTATANGYNDLGFRFLYVGRHGVATDDKMSLSLSNIGLGLLLMGARHYSPALGRFIQPDPTAADANLYAYADDSPITRADPCGTFPSFVEGFCKKQFLEIINKLETYERRLRELKGHGDDGHLKAIEQVLAPLRALAEKYNKGPCPKYIKLPSRLYDRTGIARPGSGGRTNFAPFAVIGAGIGGAVAIWWGAKVFAPVFGPFGVVWLIVG